MKNDIAFHFTSVNATNNDLLEHFMFCHCSKYYSVSLRCKIICCFYCWPGCTHLTNVARSLCIVRSVLYE